MLKHYYYTLQIYCAIIFHPALFSILVVPICTCLHRELLCLSYLFLNLMFIVLNNIYLENYPLITILLVLLYYYLFFFY